MINPQFEDAESFQDGLAAVEVAGKTGFIDRYGTIVVTSQFGVSSADVEKLPVDAAQALLGVDQPIIDDADSNSEISAPDVAAPVPVQQSRASI